MPSVRRASPHADDAVGIVGRGKHRLLLSGGPTVANDCRHCRHNIL